MEKWYIIQTRPRWERKVADGLEQKGFETFYPVRKVKRKWSDRIKTVEEPVFKGYLLVKVAEEQKTEVRLLDGVINFVYQNGKAINLKGKDIEVLRKMLQKRLEEESSALNSVYSAETTKDIYQSAVSLADSRTWLNI